MTTPNRIRALECLCQDVLAAGSPSSLAQILVRDLPPLLGAASVRLYLFKPAARSLESVVCPGSSEPIATSVDRPSGGIVAAAVRCFRQGSLLNIPRLRRDDTVNPDGKKGLPRAAVFAPVLSLHATPDPNPEHSSLGVIEAIRTRRFGAFDADDLSILKLIAEQTAAALALQELAAANIQVAKSEQLAANAQLIANSAAGLRPRLDRILNLFSELPASPANPILAEAHEEALSASEALTRLTSFAGLENSAACPPDANFDANALLAELIHFRSAHWNQLGLRIQNHLSPEPALVLGQRGQLEHALLDMAIHAERAAAASGNKLLAISSSSLAGRIVVQMTFPASESISLKESIFDDASLKLCKQIANRHAGDFQLRSQGEGLAFELDLPLAIPPGKANSKLTDDDHDHATPIRALTLMLVDTDPAARKQLLGLVAQRGHRVIPVAEEEASLLAQRLRFDGILWAVRAGGPKWSEYQQRLRELIPAFILISSGYDAAFASSLAEGGGYLLARPVQEPDLDRVLEKLTANYTAQV